MHLDLRNKFWYGEFSWDEQLQVLRDFAGKEPGIAELVRALEVTSRYQEHTDRLLLETPQLISPDIVTLSALRVRLFVVRGILESQYKALDNQLQSMIREYYLAAADELVRIGKPTAQSLSLAKDRASNRPELLPIRERMEEVDFRVKLFSSVVTSIDDLTQSMKKAIDAAKLQ